MKYFFGFFVLILAIGTIFIFLQKENVSEINNLGFQMLKAPVGQRLKLEINKNLDIEPQKPLDNPPKEIKAIYSTSWSVAAEKNLNYLINLIKSTEINAIVIDIKDYSGYIAYNINLPIVDEIKAKEIRIPKINALIKQLHNENIYVIARITVFQDPRFAKARPDLAIHSKFKLKIKNQESKVNEQLSLETLWLDNKKLEWMNSAAKEVWDYNIAIAKDAVSRGFDELNFDYIRFASDGDLDDMYFPLTRTNTGLTQNDTGLTQTDINLAQNNAEIRSEIIRNFFKYLRESLPGVKISADLFGLSTIQMDDMGIGQIIENAYQYFDYICPMLYPSHFAADFLGYKNPAKYPYEVVKYSMDSAFQRLKNYEFKIRNSTSTENLTFTKPLNSKLRPWLQDFDLGADYNAEMVKKEIQAVYDSSLNAPEFINGFMLWNSSNVYTIDALSKEL